jgi:hypothetical protein
MNLITVYAELLKLCGVKNWERWTESAKLQAVYENSTTNSIFAENELDQKNPYNRIETISRYPVRFWKLPLKFFCNTWLCLQVLEHRMSKHDDCKAKGWYWFIRPKFDFCKKFFPVAMGIIDQFEITRKDFWL